jgi:hypothetical protein
MYGTCRQSGRDMKYKPHEKISSHHTGHIPTGVVPTPSIPRDRVGRILSSIKGFFLL